MVYSSLMKRVFLFLPLVLAACSSDPGPAPAPAPKPAPPGLAWRLEAGDAFSFRLTSTVKVQTGKSSREYVMTFEGNLVIDDVLDGDATGHFEFTRVEGRFASGGDPIRATIPAAELKGRSESCTLSKRGELGVMAPFTLGRTLDLSDNFVDLFVALPATAREQEAGWKVGRHGQAVAIRAGDAGAKPGTRVLEGTPVPPAEEADVPRGRVVAVFDLQAECVTKVSEDLEFVETQQAVRTKKLLQRRLELERLK